MMIDQFPNANDPEYPALLRLLRRDQQAQEQHLAGAEFLPVIPYDAGDFDRQTIYKAVNLPLPFKPGAGKYDIIPVLNYQVMIAQIIGDWLRTYEHPAHSDLRTRAYLHHFDLQVDMTWLLPSHWNRMLTVRQLFFATIPAICNATGIREQCLEMGILKKEAVDPEDEGAIEIEIYRIIASHP